MLEVKAWFVRSFVFRIQRDHVPAQWNYPMEMYVEKKFRQWIAARIWNPEKVFRGCFVTVRSTPCWIRNSASLSRFIGFPKGWDFQRQRWGWCLCLSLMSAGNCAGLPAGPLTLCVDQFMTYLPVGPQGVTWSQITSEALVTYTRLTNSSSWSHIRRILRQETV